ncbi:hypothetical protein XF30_11060 [Bradyrhizobium sp. SUTN9-2]|nr:hypothetical protein XF30_11060 [Bradyrhizobium sp. SUTN9-2]
MNVLELLMIVRPVHASMSRGVLESAWHDLRYYGQPSRRPMSDGGLATMPLEPALASSGEA